MPNLERVIILVDMDCFYCQVEEQLNPKLKGKPIAVVQYNAWRGGGIIAVNYPARDLGVTRHMRGNDARQKCPNIELVRVPQIRGKADLTKYRDAGKRVADVLQTFTPLLERASVDEAYLDVTELVEKRISDGITGITVANLPNTYIVGSSIEDFIHNVLENGEFTLRDMKLAVGAVIAEEIRAEVFNKTGYRCSAGIAHNKILAKLVCGLHKPNKQTVLPHEAIAQLYKDLPVRKIRSLGGKFGDTVSEVLGISYMGELMKFTEKQLIQRFDEKTGTWLYNIARGIDSEPVTTRLISKSIGCCKKFPGRTALKTSEEVEHWISELTQEIGERLCKDSEENNRKAKQIIVSFAQEVKGKDVSSSRTHPLVSYDYKKLAQNVLDVIRRFCMRANGTYHIKFLGISVGGFEDTKKVREITSFFKSTTKETEIEKSVDRKETSKNISHYFQNLEYQNENQAIKNECNSGNGNTSRCEHNSASSSNFECFKDYLTFEEEENKNISDSNNSDDNISNSSIWSAETQDMNIDPESLIFLPVDTKPDDEITNNSDHSYVSNRVSPVINLQNTNEESQDSISDEILSSNSHNTLSGSGRPSLSERPQSSSFFQNYFDNLKVERICESPVERNFDTSKILEDVESEDSFEEKTDNQDACNELNQDDAVVPYHKDEDSVDLEVQCPQCGKLIKNINMVSHMDYHYALQIVREESSLYKNEIKPKVTPNKGHKKKKSTKSVHSDNNRTSIKSFFSKDEQIGNVPLENSEVCSECNKRIRSEESSSHKDYHIAKKLHAEINVQVTNTATSKSVSKTNDKLRPRKTPLENVASISSYFKPL